MPPKEQKPRQTKKPKLRLWDAETKGEGTDITMAHLLRESDRGALLVGGAMLDEALFELLDAVFSGTDKQKEELLSGGDHAPMGSFSARIKVCHAPGLFDDDLFYDFDIVVRGLRNGAAHFEKKRQRGLDTSFAYKAVVDDLFKLRTVGTAFRDEFKSHPRYL